MYYPCFVSIIFENINYHPICMYLLSLFLFIFENMNCILLYTYVCTYPGWIQSRDRKGPISAGRDFYKFITSYHGCQIFLGQNIPKWEQFTKLPQTIPNCHTLCQIAIKYSKWSQNITTFSIPRHFKIYPNWYFWFENKPSSNPASYSYAHSQRRLRKNTFPSQLFYNIGPRFSQPTDLSVNADPPIRRRPNQNRQFFRRTGIQTPINSG
jgi:hypothetical protein